MPILLDLEDARNQAEAWKNKVFEEFYSVMLNENEKFPCIFGTAGVKNQQVRYFFLGLSFRQSRYRAVG